MTEAAQIREDWRSVYGHRSLDQPFGLFPVDAGHRRLRLEKIDLELRGIHAGRAESLALGRGEFRHQPFGPAADGAGEVEIGRGRRAAGQDEGAQRGDSFGRGRHGRELEEVVLLLFTSLGSLFHFLTRI